MKTKDQVLLEEAYGQILNEYQLRLIEEGKITDFLKKLGKGATISFLKAKNALTANPSLMKKFTRASGILLALAAGNTAEAATYGADFVNDLIRQITSASADGTITSDDLQNIMSRVEQSHSDIASSSASTTADQFADQAIQSSGDKLNRVKSAMSNIGSGGLEGIDAVAKEIDSIAGSDKIENILNKWDVEIKNLSRPSSYEQIASEIASEAQYRRFSLDQVKQILNSVDTQYLSPKIDIQKLISKIKF